MSGFPLTLRDFRLYLEGFDTGHNVSEVTLPKISHKTETVNIGTFQNEVPMGLQALTCEMSFYSLSKTTLATWGLANTTIGQLVSLRGVYATQAGTTSAIQLDMRGAFKEIDHGTWKKGDLNTIKLTATLWQYSYRVDGFPMIDIDLETNTYIVSGINQIPKHNQALGIL